MEKQLGSFKISEQTLHFQHSFEAIKTTIKNTSLRSTSYDIDLSDNDHFKLIGHRVFTLAPGISKTLQFKHIDGPQCKNEDKHKKIIVVSNSFERAQFLTCICPSYTVKFLEDPIDFEKLRQIGEFNKRTICRIPVMNNSQNNLKLFFSGLQKADSKFTILNDSLIALSGDILTLKIEVYKAEYGILSESIYFSFLKEQQLNNQNYQSSQHKKYEIRIEGDCTNRSLIVKDDSNQITELKIECLNGTSKQYYFYLENMFNKDIEYFLTVSVLAQTPTDYAKKWRSTNISFVQTQGLIKSRKSEKITFKLNTQFDENDENYSKKYCKIQYSDDKSALVLRNNAYAKKNVEFVIKINFKDQMIMQSFPSTSIPIKCLLINPSIRFHAKQTQNHDEILLKLINQSRLPVPFWFSQHSLYRTSHEKGELMPRIAMNVILKWTKKNQKCRIFAEIPDLNILVFDPKVSPQKGTISRPASRRPMTSQKLLKQRFNRDSSTYNNRPISGIPLTSLSSNIKNHRSQYTRALQITEQIPKVSHLQIIPEKQLDCIIIQDRTIKNSHLQFIAIIEIKGQGYLKLGPGQSYSFDDDWKSTVQFKIVGHDPIFKISPVEQKGFFQTLGTGTFSRQITEKPGVKSLYPYKILSKQLSMSFKDNSGQFQIIDFIPIKNCYPEPLKVNCLTLQNEFFHCKEPNNSIIIPPFQIGKFKISFMPKNIVSLRALANQPPKENRRKAIVHSIGELEIKDQVSKVRKQIKLLINKKIQIIKCIGEIVEKRCTLKPESIQFIGCKYGSAETFQTFMITCLSSKPINFFIEHPEQVVIKPKKGTIMPKNAQNCSVYFKPSRKICNYQDKIKIYIGGSHTEILPLSIDVEDPEIYIKQQKLQIQQHAICDSQNQQLNTELTIVNNTLSQSFVEIDLNNTPLFLGYSKNHTFTQQMNLIQESFNRRAKFDQQTNNNGETTNKKINNRELVFDLEKKKKCLVNVLAGTFLRVPLNFMIGSANLGENKVEIRKNFASLVGFGEISSPKQVIYHCQKTFLHIRPYKKTHEIVLTKNQQGYKIQLKNTTKNIIKIRTEISQVKNGNEEIPLICTFKDINEYLGPDKEMSLNMDFIFFDIQKNALSAQYILKFFVAETPEEESSMIPYFETQLNVFIPEPFLEINPNKLVMPTAALQSWVRQSFLITNHGYKQIFLKIKKPTNIAFQLEYTMSIYDPNQKKKNKGMINYRKEGTPTQSQHMQNKLTKIRNCLQVKLSLRSKIPISYNIILEIEDNFENKYTMFIAGTFTDSPLFTLDNYSVNSPESMTSIYSSKSFNSNSFLDSSPAIGDKSSEKKIKSELDPIDVEDLLFLNNWLGSLIPELSGESTFFYVWLTKIQNMLKFLREFEVQAFYDRESNKKKRESSDGKTLSSIFEEMKKEGFHLNSLSIDLLEKADQREWLNFMWFFFDKKILSPNFLSWISKVTNEKITYQSLSRSYPTTLPNLVYNTLNISKEKIPLDWPQLIQKLEPLLHIFKNVESRRHLILSSNILYHKLNNLRREVVETQGFEMTLSIENKQNKKVKYFLLSDTKDLNCEQSSKKTLPSVINSGYTFTLQENESVELLLSFRNVQVIKRMSSMDIILMNNIIWQPLTIYQIKFTKRSDIIHSVVIECEQKCTQEWIYCFTSKISSEYRVNLQGDPQFKLMSGNNLGYLKKNETTQIKVQYNPDSVQKHESSLIISNNLMKEIFNIKGKPLFSRKITQETNLKLTEDKQHKETILIPWEIKNNTTNIANKPNSLSSRASKNIPEFHVEFYNKTFPEVCVEHVQYNASRKEVKIQFKLLFKKKYRDLDVLVRIYNKELNQSKMIKLTINVAPKPIFIRAEMEGEDSTLIDEIPIPNVYKIPENVLIEYRMIENEQEVIKSCGKRRAQYMSQEQQYPFQIISHKNGAVVTFSDRESSKQFDNLHFKVKFNSGAVRVQKQAMFSVCLTYSQSLLKLYYIFVGRAKNISGNMIQQSSKDLTYDICILKRETKQIKICNPKSYPMKFQVTTDLHEISGKSTICVGASSSASYTFDIFCLHFGNKSGYLTFRSKEFEYNYQIHLNVLESSKNLSENELKIYRQKYTVTSKIREKTIFTVGLVNSSGKNVEYDVISTSKYLRPLSKKINIPAEGQISLDVEYLPLFVGEETGSVSLYNPYQPEISYQIKMISEEEILQIHEIMPGIGQHRSIKLYFDNPVSYNAQLQLMEIVCNNKAVPEQKWSKHLNLFVEKEMISCNKFPVKNQSKLCVHANFKPMHLEEKFSYELVFVSKEIGNFTYRILYQYPNEQIMSPTILHIEENSITTGSIAFLNRFQDTLTISMSYDKQIIQLTTITNSKKQQNNYLMIQSMLETKINFEAKPQGKSLKFVFTNINSKFCWIYPITIYKVCKSVKEPIQFRGITNDSILTKIYPVNISSVSFVKVCRENQLTPISDDLLTLKIISDVVRQRKNSEKHLNKHNFLSPQKLYEIQLEMWSSKTLKLSGFLYLYASSRKPRISGSLTETDKHCILSSSKECQYVVQKIPYEIMINESPTKIIELFANVGDKCKVIMKFDQFLDQSHLVKSCKALDYQLSEMKLTLFNNKGNQFLVQINEEEEQLEIIYYAKEYSSLKKARLQVKHQNSLYIFLLVGKYPQL